MIQYWIMLMYSLLLFTMTILRKSIQDGMTFYYQCQSFRPMISRKVCTNWEYVSPRNSNPDWNCTKWRFIGRYRCPIFKNWRRWWREPLIRDFDQGILIPETREVRQKQWSRVAGDFVVLKEDKENATNGKQKDNASRGDKCSFRWR